MYCLTGSLKDLAKMLIMKMAMMIIEYAILMLERLRA